MNPLDIRNMQESDIGHPDYRIELRLRKLFVELNITDFTLWFTKRGKCLVTDAILDYVHDYLPQSN